MKKAIFRRVLSATLAFLLLISVFPITANEVDAATYTGCLSQHDSRWGSVNINGGTISATGCGVLSLVNTIGYLSGKQLDVVATARWANAVGGFNPNGAEGVYRYDLYPHVEAKYGAEYGIKVDCGGNGQGYWEGAYSTRLKNHLLNGGVAIGHVYNHFLSIVGYNATTNKFHIYDSSATSRRGTNYNGGDVWVTEAAFSTGNMDLDWFCLLSSTRKQETWIEKACFDVMVYRDRNPDLATMTDSQLKEHWLNSGIKEGRASSTILDLGFYANNNPDVKNSFTKNGKTDYAAIYNHFVTSGYKENRKSSALFDGAYYTEKYPDVASSFKEQYLRHYVENGMAEGRRASLTFDPDYYWFIRPDVYEAWPDDYTMCARHYAGHGINAQIEAYDNKAPVISEAKITNVSAAGYTVTCKVTDNWGLSKVSFPTWTLLNNQDDLADDFMNTQQGTKNGDYYTFQVKASAHNNEGGMYVTHIYAIDKGGNRVQLALDNVEVKDSTPEVPVPETPVPETPTPTVPSTLGQISLISAASYSIENTLVENVKPATTVASLLAQFENDNLQVRDMNGKAISDSTVVGTGATISLYSNGQLVQSITVCILGDMDGNGRIDSTDYMRIKAAFLDTFTLNDVERSAADVDGNGRIDSTDYMRIKAHFLGTYNLHG